MKLASYLTKDYELVYGKVFRKEDLIAEINGKQYRLDRKDDVWVLANKNRDGDITTASTIVNHGSLIRLAKEIGMNLADISIEWLQIPTTENGNHAIVQCKYEGCPPIIGEANTRNLKGAMDSYSATMALKRGIDRIITHFTGLYENGIYSSSELGGEFGAEQEVEQGKDHATPKSFKNKDRELILDKLRTLVKNGVYSKLELDNMLSDITNGKKKDIVDANINELEEVFRLCE